MSLLSSLNEITSKARDLGRQILYGDQANTGGKYVDQHKYSDDKRPGAQTSTGRMYDIYDQSRQERVVVNKGAMPKSAPYLAIAAFVVGYIIEAVLFPKVQNIFPFNFLWFLASKQGLSRFIHGFVLGGLFAAGVFFLFFLDNDINNFDRRHTKTMLDDPDSNNQSFIDIPEEEPYKYDIVPDTKVHFKNDVTSLLSHLMIKQIPSLKGKDGNVHFDNDFSQKMFDLAHVPSELRKIYDPATLAYNPDGQNGKNDGRTVKDTINKYWHVPKCEDPDSQDPAGVYIVSTKPENTVVAAETRAGKGQHYIEEMLDIWSREDHKPNIVVTDLKMELLRQFLKTFTLRGYNVKALNLLVDSKTDAINFIGYAVNAAIRGDSTQMQTLVRNLAEIYFPNKGSDNPMWTQAAGAVFTRTVLGLIDFYYEKVQDIKSDPNLSLAEIAQRSDEAWGHVTLYNAYRFVVDMAGKMYPKDTYEDIYPKDRNGNILDPDPDATAKSGLTIYFDATNQLPQNSIREKIAEQNGAIKVTGKSERTMASIYAVTLFGMIFFTDSKVINLTSARPSQNLDMKGFAFPRRIAVKFNKYFMHQHSYKYAITKWECFHDPEMKIPYKGKGFTWQGSVDKYGWADAYFEGIFDNGKTVVRKVADRRHPGRYVNRKIFQPAITYIRLTIYDPAGVNDPHTPNLILGTYDFRFKKSYRKSMNGASYAINPITGKREVLGGVMEEYTYIRSIHKEKRFISHFDKFVHSLNVNVDLETAKTQPIRQEHRIIDDYDIHYTDKPTALFLVAPPSTPAYNKLLLNTIDLLYNEQVSTSFLGQSNQKPFYVTKYMLDEFGNMQSDGTGVPALDAKLTSGLAQGQQFTMILQSMEQLKTIYGDSVAQILQANVGTFFFLKSKDTGLINLLIGMNGKKVVINHNSQSYQKPVSGFHLRDQFIGQKGVDNRPQVNESYTKEERDLLDANAYLHLNDDVTDGNAIVSRGSATVVSKGPTILPMSFMLYGSKHTGGYGENMVNRNLPVMADAGSTNPLNNIPDFEEMIAQRIQEAIWAPKVRKRYMEVEGLSAQDMKHIDRDELAKDLMRGIHLNMHIADEAKQNKEMQKIQQAFQRALMEATDDQYETKTPEEQTKLDKESTIDMTHQVQKLKNDSNGFMKKAKEKHAHNRAKAMNTTVVGDAKNDLHNKATENIIMKQANKQAQDNYAKNTEKIYAHNQLSRGDLYGNNAINTRLMNPLRKATFDLLNSGFFESNPLFTVKVNDDGGSDLYSRNNVLLVHDKHDVTDYNSLELKGAYGKYLTSFDSWDDEGLGTLDDKLADYYNQLLQDEQDTSHES